MPIHNSRDHQAKLMPDADCPVAPSDEKFINQGRITAIRLLKKTQIYYCI